MSNRILQTFALGARWPTLDPFLFCVHHLDEYPAGNESFGPAASLAGHEIGSDFAGVDGWRMYHGDVVPGFPQHPHRGFETVTYVRRGLIDHADSLGAAARYGRGDVQWLTAGRGIVHAEMFPLLDAAAPNTTELFQIWLNLASADKMADPYFEMYWHADIPRHVVEAEGGRAEVTVVAGAFADVRPASPPPDSWAARADSDVAIWHIRLEPGSAWTMPAIRHEDTARVVYCFEGEGMTIDGTAIPASTGALVDASTPLVISSESGAECLVLQGRPIGEPVAQYGPFVMNDQAGIEQAFEDYRRTEFGGWPWPVDGPVHGGDGHRFIRRPGGAVEHPLVDELSG